MDNLMKLALTIKAGTDQAKAKTALDPVHGAPATRREYRAQVYLDRMGAISIDRCPLPCSGDLSRR